MNKLVKLMAIGVIASNITACISTTGLAREQINDNKNEGILYGLNVKTTKNILDICKAIENKDDRCKSPNDFGSARIFSKVGFADGPMGAIAIFNISEIDIDEGCTFPISSSCVFYKVDVQKNKLATIVSKVSSKDNQHCKWNGLNGAGGTVCTEFNWDYRKDNKPAIFF